MHVDIIYTILLSLLFNKLLDNFRYVSNYQWNKVLANIVGIERDGPAQLIIYGCQQIGEPAKVVVLRVAGCCERLFHADQFVLGQRGFDNANVRVCKMIEKLIFLTNFH